MSLANAITLARLPLLPLLLLLVAILFVPFRAVRLLGLGLLIVLYLDWFDGYVARLRNEVTEMGAVLDVALDRAVENMPLKEKLGADWLIATEVGQNASRFTGELTGLHPRGENKPTLLVELSRAQGLDLSRSFAYGDHFQDFHLFRRIGFPVVVNPSGA
ncbi:MAG: hypothetical protein C4567_11020 [Deltaproteobacteria bacterium]|nr:MAG: hypothetical protein C4567_11020 [Deltaproteobacteria bacterium]